MLMLLTTAGYYQPNHGVISQMAGWLVGNKLESEQTSTTLEKHETHYFEKYSSHL
jgi:hypothetical protein